MVTVLSTLKSVSACFWQFYLSTDTDNSSESEMFEDSCHFCFWPICWSVCEIVTHLFQPRSIRSACVELCFYQKAVGWVVELLAGPLTSLHQLGSTLYESLKTLLRFCQDWQNVVFLDAVINRRWWRKDWWVANQIGCWLQTRSEQ